MNTRYCVLSCLLAVFILTFQASAYAVTYGEPDGTDHPYVALMIFDIDGQPAYRCSGTLLAPTIMVTSAFCAEGASGGRAWFDPVVDDLYYPFGGGTSVEFAELYLHPDYQGSDADMHEIAVVILSESVETGGTYAMLPPIGILDELAIMRGSPADRTFDVVGYGLQSIKPVLQDDRERYAGEVLLLSVERVTGVPAGMWATFTNSPSRIASGGTCFGDSGGPTLWEGNFVVGLHTFQLNSNCKGIDLVYRLDTVSAQTFISQFLSD